MFPKYALGYWHSKNRYESADQLLTVARGFAERKVNVSVIVVDFHHWRHMGDFAFDSRNWTEAPWQWIQTLRDILPEVEVMVSVWPFLATNSTGLAKALAEGLVMTRYGENEPIWWNDNNCAEIPPGGAPGPVIPAPCVLYDPTQQAARDYVWSKIKSGYIKNGIRTIWLDGAEPEISTGAAQFAANHYNSSIGSGQATGMGFPLHHAQMVYDGLLQSGINGMALARSGWIGMSRYGTALWSGDTSSRWHSLEAQVGAGLGAQLSGIAWWTSDIGGYHKADVNSTDFRQLIVRWFQFGFTCPLFRQHGKRPTEIWLYGDEASSHIQEVIKLRYKFAPYIATELNETARSGRPFNRPLWWDFPQDEATWNVTDAYMFGSKFLVAPVTSANVSSKVVYLPMLGSDEVWRHYFSRAIYPGGKNATIHTPMDSFPLLERILITNNNKQVVK